MSKPSWKYNPLADAGISLASQEDAARATEDERGRDLNKHNDIRALAVVFRAEFRDRLIDRDPYAVAQVLSDVAHGLRADYASGKTMRDVLEWHDPGAVLAALKQAYDHPEPITSDVVEFP